MSNNSYLYDQVRYNFSFWRRFEVKYDLISSRLQRYIPTLKGDAWAVHQTPLRKDREQLMVYKSKFHRDSRRVFPFKWPLTSQRSPGKKLRWLHFDLPKDRSSRILIGCHRLFQVEPPTVSMDLNIFFWKIFVNKCLVTYKITVILYSNLQTFSNLTCRARVSALWAAPDPDLLSATLRNTYSSYWGHRCDLWGLFASGYLLIPAENWHRP